MSRSIDNIHDTWEGVIGVYSIHFKHKGGDAVQRVLLSYRHATVKKARVT